MSACKRDIPTDVYEVLMAYFDRLAENPGAPPGQREEWFLVASSRLPTRAKQIARALRELRIPVSTVTQHYYGVGTVSQSNATGSPIATLNAGGDMVGVNANGTQTFRDLTAYSRDLVASEGVIDTPLRDALVGARKGLEESDIVDSIKPLLIEQFDKLTEELKKGGKKDASVLGGLWAMISGTVSTIKSAGSAAEALEKLRQLIWPASGGG